jgi:prepilin peptidase CpaA
LSEMLTEVATWLQVRGNLVIPLTLTLWIAWGDVKTRRIPNYLTLGTAAAGLAYNLIFQGWPGLLGGFLGMLMGFGFLILPYIWGGMGAGDVKALAALGAWLGPWGTVFLFCYMGMAGGLLALVVLWWKGLLWQKIRRGWICLANHILSRPGGLLQAPSPPQEETPGIPYGVAIAVGMVALLGLGNGS